MRSLIDVRDVKLGVTDVGSGPAFLWLHGGFASRARDEAHPTHDHDGWARLESRFRVVRWDARGHGESSGPDDPESYGLDNHARDELALADALGIDRFAVGGISMGAMTAIHVALLAPERVAALVLMLPGALDMRPMQEANAATAALVEERGLAAFEEGIKRLPVPLPLAHDPALFHAGFVPDVNETLVPAMLRGTTATKRPDDEQLAAIEAPTLILAWDGDVLHPLSSAERLAELIPRAELNVAHEFDDFAAWLDVIESFLSRASSEKGE